jgi:signal transduction histidine kinase/DNA-binding response OmpR family regulator/ligand-binding sensor domain-containing protein
VRKIAPFISRAFIVSLCFFAWHGAAQPARFKHYSSDEGYVGSAFKKIVQDSLGFLWINSNQIGLVRFDGNEFKTYPTLVDPEITFEPSRSSQIWVDPAGKVWIGFLNHISTFDRDTDSFVDYRFSRDGFKPVSTWFEGTSIIWLGLQQNGLLSFDAQTKESFRYINTEGNSKSKEARNTIHNIVDNGASFLLATGEGIWEFDRGAKQFRRPEKIISDSLALYKSNVLEIFKGEDYSWIWTEEELVKVNLSFKILQRLEFKTALQQFDIAKSQTGPAIRSIVQGKDGVFWIASQGLGLIRYNPSDGQLENFRSDLKKEGSLPSDLLFNVMLDRDQNLWMTTVNKGIVKLKKPDIHFYNFLPGTSTTGIVTYRFLGKDHLVVATNGQGLWTGVIDLQDLGGLKLAKVPLSHASGFENITELALGSNKIWIGSLNAGIMMLPIDENTAAIESNKAKLFQHINNDGNTIAGNFIGGLYEDEQGNLLAGSMGNGMNVINNKKKYGTPGSVTQYHHSITDPNSIYSDDLLDIAKLENETMLIATNQGLDLFDNGKFKNIFKGIVSASVNGPNGLLFIGTNTGLYESQFTSGNFQFNKVPLLGHPFITDMQQDKSGGLWISSFSGLYYFNKENQLALKFTKEDGLPSSRTVTAAGSAQTPDGIMIFSNAEGLTLFDPASFRLNPLKPKPIITQLKLNNKVVSSSNYDSLSSEFVIPHNIATLKELEIPHTQNILTLEFSAMDFTSPEKNVYQYKLEGFENDWVQTNATNRTATYTNLDAGSYTFKVKASNSDGIWNNNETTLKINVLPPPWKTWWAYTTYFTVIIGLMFLTRRSIVQRERLMATLKLERVELEKVQEIDKVKTNFFTNISHEFRTPLTLIQGPVQDLLDQFKKNSEAKSKLNLIQQNSERLLRLVNQMLELAKLESGGLKKELTEGDLISFLRAISNSFSSISFQKHISLVQQFPEQVIEAFFDKDKLEKIMSNLISNAIKFTPEHGAIILNAEVDIGHLILRVTDTGKGVPKEQLDKIFGRFYQVSEDGKQNVGSGIGLALSKELTEFLGGTLVVESALGQGSKFTLSLPIQLIHRTDIQVVKTIDAKEQESIPSSNGHEPELIKYEKPLLLVVEDHTDLRKFIISCLGNDYEYLEASNGQEGLKLALDQVPALILSDVMMPEMDGIEMCNKIKRDNRTNHIPVILLTAKASDESKLSGLEIGADDYLIKPFDKHELVFKIKNQIATRTKMQERIRREFLSNTSTVKAVSADEKFLELVKKIIEARLTDEQLGVEAVAEEVGLSRSQLYRKITALTGLSMNVFIRKLRLQKAHQLLAQNWGPVSQVAYEVGFSNLSYFSKCFKEEFGKLPSEFIEHSKLHDNE